MFSTSHQNLRRPCTARLIPQRGRRWGAFSLIELLVSIAMVVVLVALLLTVVSRSRAAAQSVSCTSNLRQIHGAMMLYCRENSGRFPDPYELDTTWEQMLFPRFITSRSGFRCDADPEIFPSIGSSYDWRDTPRADTTLAGRSMSDVNRYDAVVVFEALPSWHALDRMNVVRMDGAAMTLDQDAALSDLRRPIRTVGATSPAAIRRGP